MTIHSLKTWPNYFNAIREGRKRFEYRKNDRNFQVGDLLRLREYEPVHETYTGREVFTAITYILENGWTENGWAILSIGPPSDEQGETNAEAALEVKVRELQNELATATDHINEDWLDAAIDEAIKQASAEEKK